MRFFDAHAHTSFAAFKDDYKEVIARALEKGVWISNVGTQYDTSERAIEVAHEYSEGVFATVGLHPAHTDRSYHDAQELGGGEAAKELVQHLSAGAGFVSRGEEFDYEKYLELARDPKVIAIGECGLDYYHMESLSGPTTGRSEEKLEKQKTVFKEHIRLAKEIKKPLMVHCRNAHSTSSGQAFSDLIAVLKESTLPQNPGVVHFFTGTSDDAKELLELGFSLTFGGVITFARDYDAALAIIPIHRILSETDAPYVAPIPYRGKRNEPVYVIEVVKKLAEVKGVSFEMMADQIFENTETVFSL